MVRHFGHYEMLRNCFVEAAILEQLEQHPTFNAQRSIYGVFVYSLLCPE